MYMPVLLEEMRPLKTVVPKIIADGNRGKITNRRDLLDLQYTMPLIIEADLGKYGKRKIEIYVFKPDSELEKGQKRAKKRYTTEDMAVFFTINGQTHASLGRSFLKNRCKKPQLAKDLLVHIDFDLSGADRIDVFMPSRDRMKKTTETKEIQDKIQDNIKNDETLRELDEIRFRKLVENTKTDLKFVDEFIERFLEKNPSYRKYLKPGSKVKQRQAVGTELKGEYKPPFFPNIFKIKGWGEAKGAYIKEIPIDSKGARVLFELNAPDDYFDREEEPGTLTVEPANMLVRRKLLHGTLDLRFIPLKGAEPGDTHPVNLSISRYEDDPLVQHFKVKYIQPSPKITKTSVSKKKTRTAQCVCE